LAEREARKKNPETRAVAIENPVTTRLLAIQKTIDEKDFSKAAAELDLLAEQHPDDVRIFYSLGRVASLAAESIADPDAQAKKLLEAKTAYSKVISKRTDDTDKALLSLTFVALGRIYEFLDDPAYALRLYEEAVKLTNVPGGAFQAALAAKQRLLKSQ
jgi:tetratricopeptide (TPR) repeat protein